MYHSAVAEKLLLVGSPGEESGLDGRRVHAAPSGIAPGGAA